MIRLASLSLLIALLQNELDQFSFRRFVYDFKAALSLGVGKRLHGSQSDCIKETLFTVGDVGLLRSYVRAGGLVGIRRISLPLMCHTHCRMRDVDDRTQIEF